MDEDWRELSTEDREEFCEWVRDTTKSRNKEGREIYGDTFQGDPLIHAGEELIDALFYLWMEKRLRGSMQTKILKLEEQVKQLQSEGPSQGAAGASCTHPSQECGLLEARAEKGFSLYGCRLCNAVTYMLYGNAPT